MKKENWNEIIRYGFVGILTTLVNYIVFVFVLYMNTEIYLIANTIAWVVAVIFAYYTNKIYVFKKEGKDEKEMLSFIFMRLLTLIIENILLFLLIQLLYMPIIISKIAVSLITILSNYVVCKWKIFKGEGEMI